MMILLLIVALPLVNAYGAQAYQGYSGYSGYQGYGGQKPYNYQNYYYPQQQYARPQYAQSYQYPHPYQYGQAYGHYAQNYQYSQPQPQQYYQPYQSPYAVLDRLLGIPPPPRRSRPYYGGDRYIGNGIHVDSHGNGYLGDKDTGLYLFCSSRGCVGRG